MHTYFRRVVFQRNKHLEEETKKQPVEKNEKNQEEKIEELQEKTSRVIFRAKSLFPFDFFPDEIIIDEVKITVRHHFFFGTEQILTIMIDEVQDVSITTAIFLAKVYLKRIKQGWDLQPFSIGSLKVSDARKIKSIILGLLIVKSQGVDLSEVSAADLSQKLEDIGKASKEK